MIISKLDRIKGGFWGMLIGDAWGVPYEFKQSSMIPEMNEITMIPPINYSRTYPGISPGTWSDDGAQALCLLASLLECGKVDPENLMRKFADWYQQGYMAVNKHVFDIGIQTRQAISAFQQGIAALNCAENDEYKNGNGSLMRVLPLVLWHRGTDENLIEEARLQSRVTHAHLRAQLCCTLYCLWGRCILEERAEPWEEAVRILREVYPAGSAERIELDTQIRPDDAPAGKGSGYVVDCLHSARLAMQQNNYEDAVRTAIKLGNDTDTTACVAGGIAGLKFGFNSIPHDAYELLLGKSEADTLLQQLMMLHG